MKAEEEKVAIEKERVRQEGIQREAAEKERLRLEVEKLESTIDAEVCFFFRGDKKCVVILK